MKYNLFDIYWDQSDINAISDVIQSSNNWAQGYQIQEFEALLQDYLNIKWVITFNSGTSALYSFLKVWKIKDCKIIVPSFTHISTVNCIVLAGGIPVFADIEKETMGLDIQDVRNKIDSDVRGIIVVHYGGRVAKNIKELKRLAFEKDIFLFEDTAESLGAMLNNQFAGTFGDFSMLSFCQNKVITTGEGGAICTNNSIIAKSLEIYRSHGNLYSIGQNFRMPTICAALGISQLRKIDKIIELRRQVGKYYDKKLSEIDGIEIIPELKNQSNVYQLYSFLVKDNDTRNKLMKYLLKKGIECKIYFKPIHLHSYHSGLYSSYGLEYTEEIGYRILSIPMSCRLTKYEQNYIINNINYFLRK